MSRHAGGIRVLRAARAAVTFLGAAVVACVVLLPAAASTRSHSKYGGTLVVGLAGGDPDSLDPTVSRGTGIAIYADMCLKLYQSVPNHGKVVAVPLLAAGLPVLSKD